MQSTITCRNLVKTYEGDGVTTETVQNVNLMKLVQTMGMNNRLIFTK